MYVLLNMERINPNGLLRLAGGPLHGFQIDNRKERANDGLCTCKAEAPFLCLSLFSVLYSGIRWRCKMFYYSVS